MRRNWIGLTLGVIVLAIGALLAAPSADWNNGGWVVKDSYTNPNPTIGETVATLAGIVGFSIGVDALPQTATANIALSAGEMTVTKRWTSTDVLNTKYAISAVSGDGSAAFDSSGKLVYTINAVNDGLPHNIQFTLKPIGATWITKLPLIRNYALPRVTFSSDA